MSTQVEYEIEQSFSAQAPAMVAVTTKVGTANEHGHTPVLNLKLAISRYDIATVETRDDKEIFVNFEDLSQNPIDYHDIPQQDMAVIFRAVDELREYLARPKTTSGVEITVQKNIPFDTHLGGRGATAAAVLVALARLWDANMAREDLTRLAQRVDKAAAESLTGGAIMTHTSATEDTLTQVLTQQELALVIVPAAADIGPDEIQQKLSTIRKAQQDDSHGAVLEFDAALLQALAHGDAHQVALLMHNDFQPALVSILPEHNDWLTAGMSAGALAAQTIDRGPSLVFVAKDLQDATELAERFEERMEIAAVAEYGPVAGAHVL